MQIESDKSAEFQAQWAPVIGEWSDRTLNAILTQGVVPGTREAVDGLSEISKTFLSTETTETGMAIAQEALKILIPIMLATVAAILKSSHPSLEEPFLREIKFYAIPGVGAIEQEILAMYQERLARQGGASHA